MAKVVLAQDPLSEAIRLEQRAINFAQERQFDQALPLFEQALSIREQIWGSDHPQVAPSLYNLGKLYYYTGDYLNAIDFYGRSLRIQEATVSADDPSLVNTLVGLAIAYGDQGNYAQAITLLERGLQIQEAALAADHPDLMFSLVNLGAMQTIQGNYAAAIVFLERALAIQKATLPATDLSMATTLINLATIYRNQGNYAQAIALHGQALKIREQGLPPNHPDIAVSLNNLAVAYSDQGDHPQAIALHERALKIREAALPPNHPDIARSLNNLGILYSIQDNHSRAIAVHERALNLRKVALPPTHPDIAQTLNNLGITYSLLGQPERAIALHQRALKIRETALSTNHPILTSSLNNLGQLYAKQGNYPQSLQALARSLEIEERNLSHNLVVGSEEYKRNYLRTFERSTNLMVSLHLQQIPENHDAATLALTTILRRKGRLLDTLSDAAGRLRENVDTGDIRLFDTLSQLRTQMATLTFKPNPGSDNIQTLQTLDIQAQELERQLSARSAVFRQETQLVTIEAVQAQIPVKGALIEFIRYHDSDQEQDFYGAYILGSSGPPTWVDLGEATVLDQALDQFRLIITDPRSAIATVKQAGRHLDQRLMAPVRKKINKTNKNVDHFLIAPDSQLNVIPFAALVDEQDQFLVENYLITYLTSGRDLLHQNPQKPSTAPVIVANPSFNDSQGRSPSLIARQDGPRAADFTALREFGSLPETATEAKKIHSLLPTAQVFTEGEATETVIKNVTSPKILHLATHGFFLRTPLPNPTHQFEYLGDRPLDNPLLRSGIVLAGVNIRASGDDDGVLTALEVTAMNLRGTQLVVLSACETGLGDVATGDGVYGLRRAFILAGAASQVTSLWKVDDAATQRLMVAYYGQLQQGVPRGEALRWVQLQMLKDPVLAKAYFWSAFIPIGDWQRIDW